MKKLICFLFICIFSLVQAFALEPGNNLNKSLSAIQREFPDCIFWCESGGVKCYKTEGEGSPIMFEVKNGKVISEFMLIEGEGHFSRDWFTATVNAFSHSDYKRVLPNDGNAYIFIYSYFEVYISYDVYNNTASITYELLPKYRK